MTAIIIVGYNSQPYLEACFNSLLSQTAKDLKIIFVDNNSTDDSVTYIRKRFPEVEVIANKENYGFAKANNIGIEAAMKQKMRHVFILNPDTIVDKDCLKRLLEEADDKTILQPLILLNGTEDKINTSGGTLNFLGFSYCSDYKLPAKQVSKDRVLPTASGAAMLVPVKLLETVGLFDEELFMYHEDVDLAWRSRIAGFSIKLVPSAFVWHDYRFSHNPKKFYYVERNRLLFLLKNFGAWYRVAIFPAFLLNEIALLAYFTLKGSLGSKLQAYFGVIKLWPHVIASRQKLKKLRKKSDHELVQLLGSDMDFAEINIPLLSLYTKVLSLYWKLIAQRII